jgi:WD40 repeat protein
MALGGTLTLLDAETGEELESLGQQRGRLVAFLDQQTLVSAGGDSLLRIWDIEKRQLKVTLSGHEGGVNSLRVSQDGTTIVTAGMEGAIRLWRAPRVPSPGEP